MTAKKNINWTEFFNDINKIEEKAKQTEAMIKEAMHNAAGASVVENPMVYGFTMTVGNDGVPVVREFGNYKENGTIANKRTPLIEIHQGSDGTGSVAYVELPGVAKEDVNFVLMDNGRTSTLMIDAGKFYKEFDLNTKVKERDIKAEFNNGVLKITLTKSEPEKPKNVKINIL